MEHNTSICNVGLCVEKYDELLKELLSISSVREIKYEE